MELWEKWITEYLSATSLMQIITIRPEHFNSTHIRSMPSESLSAVISRTVHDSSARTDLSTGLRWQPAHRSHATSGNTSSSHQRSHMGVDWRWCVVLSAAAAAFVCYFVDYEDNKIAMKLLTLWWLTILALETRCETIDDLQVSSYDKDEIFSQTRTRMTPEISHRRSESNHADQEFQLDFFKVFINQKLPTE